MKLFLNSLFMLSLVLHTVTFSQSNEERELYRSQKPVGINIGLSGIGVNACFLNYCYFEYSSFIIVNSAHLNFFLLQNNASPFFGLTLLHNSAGFGGNGNERSRLGINIGYEHAWKRGFIQMKLGYIIHETKMYKSEERSKFIIMPTIGFRL